MYGPARERRYLDALRGPQGQPVQYKRTRSTSEGRRRHDSRRVRGDVRASREAGHALPGRVSLRRSARAAGFHVRSARGARPPARRSVSDGGGDRVGGARARRRPRLHADSAGSGRCDDARGRVRSVQDDRASRTRGSGGGNEARSEDRSRGGHARPHGGAGLPAVLQRQDRPRRPRSRSSERKELRCAATASTPAMRPSACCCPACRRRPRVSRRRSRSPPFVRPTRSGLPMPTPRARRAAPTCRCR